MNEKLRKEREEERKIELKYDRIINTSVNRVMEQIKDKKPKIFSKFHYGSIAINPKYLVIWYLFEKDDELREAEDNGLVDELKILTLWELKDNGYPQDVLGEIQIAFTTDEDIQNETDGNYWYYFK